MKKEFDNKNQNHVDAFFREALTDHKIKPSARVWKGISKNYLDPLFSGKTRTGLYLISALIIISLSLVFLLPSGSPEQVPENNENALLLPESLNNEAVKANNSLKNNQNQKQSPLNNKTQKQNYNNPITEQPEKETYDPVLNQEDNNSQKEPVLATVNKINNDTPVKEEFVISEPFPPSYPVFKLNFLSLNYIDYEKEPYILKTIPVNFDPFFPKDDYAKKANMYFGIHGNTGLSYYSVRSQKAYFAGDITVAYSFSELSAEAGLGLSYERDNGDFIVNYNSYDSVGFYYNITSFSYDPVDDTILFNMKEVNVYDSIQHETLKNTITGYTYLQIPIGIKYEIGKFNRISIIARTGGIFQILLAKNEPAVTGIPMDANINSMFNSVPTRLKTSWKLYAGVQFRYLLTDKIRIELEPIFMQYLQTPYERKEGFDMKRPYSVGLRTGLSFNF